MAETLSAIASVLWPLIVLLTLAFFRMPLLRVIRSAEHREFTLKLGGQEVTFDSVTKQQDNQIDDLQREISKLQARTKALEGTTAGSPATRGGEVEAAPGQSQSATWQGDRPEPRLPAASGVLWVDDHPENNAIQIDRLGRNGVMVDTALSTEEAAEKLRERRYQSIISDMGRFEHGRSVSDAGVQLVEQVRRYDQDTPVLIYASSRAVQTYGPRAKAAGANLVTSSPLELAEKLRRAGLP